MEYQVYEAKNWEIFQPQNVEFEQISKGRFIAVLDQDIRLNIAPRSAIEGQLRLGMSEVILADEFKNGKYFVVDNQVVDYRLKSNLNFVHSQANIQELMDRIGLVTAIPAAFSAGRGERARQLAEALRSNRPLARSVTERFNANALDMLGGEMDVKIGFDWSPFSIDIESVLEMWRLVCSNGMVARDPVMNNRIPMLNEWADNMKIANHVIRHAFDNRVMPRIEAMPHERISMADLSTLRRTFNRELQREDIMIDSREALENVVEVLDAAWDKDADHLQSNLLRFIPAPISAFDAMNVATEAATHHVEGTTGAQLQSWVNNLIFNDTRQGHQSLNLDSLVTDVETFSDVDRAFFGETCH